MTKNGWAHLGLFFSAIFGGVMGSALYLSYTGKHHMVVFIELFISFVLVFIRLYIAMFKE